MTDDLGEFEVSAYEAECMELRRINRQLQRNLDSAKRKSADLVAAVYEAAKDASITAPPVKLLAVEADKRRRNEEVAVLHCSDWQCGKRTTSFNSEVAAQRITLLAKKVIKLTNIERADHPVRQCHVLLGGDMLEGVTIFPGQVWEVDSSLFAQVFQVVNMINELLVNLGQVFEKVHVWEEAGNHGRLGKRGDFAGEDNADNIVYRIVQSRLEGQPNLTWHQSTHGWHSIVEIGAYRALLVHGDEVKGFGGQTPSFGITRKVNAWATGVIDPFMDCYMGHWHQPLVLPIANGHGRIFVNPSIESDNIYAQEFVGATGTPGQRFNFVDPVRGRVTSERIIWLDE